MHSKTQPTVDFIGIGTPKSGTSWLCHCLAAHPQIFISKEKELRFFYHEHKYQLGVDWYLSHFKDAKPGQKKGEFTPNYIYKEESLRKIKAFNPDIKVLIILRSPVERTLSHFRYEKRRGLETAKSPFETPEYIEKSKYAAYIERALDIFGKDHVHICFYEDLVREPQKVLRSIFLFLEVDPHFTVQDVSVRINETRQMNYYFPAINRYLKNLRNQLLRNKAGIVLLSLLRKYGITKLVGRMQRLNHYRAKEGSQTADSEDLKGRLWPLFQDDIKRLKAITGYVPPEWHKYNKTTAPR